MRLSIEIDNVLLARARAATGLRSEGEVVEAGLRLLVRRKQQADARALFGRVRWEGDLLRERLDKERRSDRRS